METPRRKELYRSTSNMRVAGVAGGLGEYFNVSANLIRLAILVSAFTGAGVLAYMIAWIVIPSESRVHTQSSKRSMPMPTWVSLAISMGLILFILTQSGSWIATSLVMVGVGLWLIQNAKKKSVVHTRNRTRTSRERSDLPAPTGRPIRTKDKLDIYADHINDPELNDPLAPYFDMYGLDELPDEADTTKVGRTSKTKPRRRFAARTTLGIIAVASLSLFGLNFVAGLTPAAQNSGSGDSPAPLDRTEIEVDHVGSAGKELVVASHNSIIDFSETEFDIDASESNVAITLDLSSGTHRVILPKSVAGTLNIVPTARSLAVTIHSEQRIDPNNDVVRTYVDNKNRQSVQDPNDSTPSEPPPWTDPSENSGNAANTGNADGTSTQTGDRSSRQGSYDGPGNSVTDVRHDHFSHSETLGVYSAEVRIPTNGETFIDLIIKADPGRLEIDFR